MILADKIIRLRKKSGWSQEELAEKMNVSRQAVSKWEGAQTIPDLEKILRLGKLFGVTTDYLLKDEIEEEAYADDVSDSGLRRVSIEEAKNYIELRKWVSWRIAFATFLCILSPIPLLILGAAAEVPPGRISENAAGAIGLAALFVFVLLAVPIYIYCGFKNAPYDFLDKSTPFELEYGVRGAVKEKQKAFRNTYIRSNIIATCICIFSPVPLLSATFVEREFFTVIMLTVTMVIAGIGVCSFIVVGVQNASMQKLLKEGEYELKEKNKSRIKETVGSIYWVLLTAIYIAWSFFSNAWHITWLVFALGGILFPAIMAICNLLIDKKE